MGGLCLSLIVGGVGRSTAPLKIQRNPQNQNPNPNRYQKGFEPLMPGFVYVDYNDAKGTEERDDKRRVGMVGWLID